MGLFSLRSRIFWAGFLVLSLVAAVFAFNLMLRNIPLLKVDVSFSRSDAEAAATQLQKKYFPDLVTTRNATQFVSDRGLQNYVELEGGGLQTFRSLVTNIDAVTHYWKVRNFSEGQEKETIMAFSAKGEPISFWLKLPEQEPGANLEESAARAIAEQGALGFMGERFKHYAAFESKVVRQATGRTDYTFIYQHQQLKVGEAQFRISVQIAGDKLVAIDTFKHIPEAFDQRFDKMRALNNHISQIANYLMMALLGLGGLVGGGYWLYKNHQLQWKKGLMPAAFVGFGLAAAVLSSLPMSWFNYDTTVSANTFLMQQIFGAGFLLVGSTLVFATIYSVAEGLSRMAFAGHPRLFDFFRPSSAATPEILGRVLGAYGWTGFFLLYAMLFVVLSSSLLGWWQPMGMASDPNVLASWRPALGPIFSALQAGTWEECLFRAVPLSLAALIGAKFGRKGLFVAVALVVQALIFGGAHANYPNLPGYSRLIELFIPAMAFGLVYLRFGLMVGILTHFLYDLVLMSLPIFLVDGGDLWIDQLLVVLAGATPLLVVLWARYKVGRWAHLANEFRNGEAIQVDSEVQNAGRSPTQVDSIQVDSTHIKSIHTESTQNVPPEPKTINTKLLLVVALVASAAFVFSLCRAPKILWPAFQLDMAQAKSVGLAELDKRGVKLVGEWHQTAYMTNGYSEGMNFVWRESDKTSFQRLIGTYLDAPHWVILWRKYDGEVEQRSEKWEVWLNPDGSLHELVHTLPEGRAGAKLTREQAGSKALGWIVEQGWGNASQLEEKAAVESVRPSRSDWQVSFLDKAAFDHKNAQAVVKITLSGDEVTGFARAIDVPEEWIRAEAEKKSKRTPYAMTGGLALLILAGIIISTFLRKHSGRKLNLRVALPWMLAIGISHVGASVMWMDGTLGSFQNTMGWSTQVWMAYGTLLLKAAAVMLLVLFMAQAIHAQRPLPQTNISADIFIGSALAVVFSGFAATIAWLLPDTGVPLGNSASWGSYVPWLTEIFNVGKAFLQQLVLLLVAIGTLRFVRGYTKSAIFAVLVLVSWLAMGLSVEDVGVALVKSFIALLNVIVVIYLVRSQQMGVALAMGGVSIALSQLHVGAALYSTSWLHAGMSSVYAVLITFGLVRHWRTNRVV